ncbi:MAG: Imm32 family immunity protein [Dehalococcoidia bacterium]
MSIEVPQGLGDVWENGFRMQATLTGDAECRVVANKPGLRTLAKLLLFISEQPPGYHFHVDQWGGGLDDRSDAQVIFELEAL